MRRAKTQNVIATLPGRSPQRIILATNTDGQSWVQEDGVSGLIAFARYYAGLPKRCRPRTLRDRVRERPRLARRRRNESLREAARLPVRQGQHRVRVRRRAPGDARDPPRPPTGTRHLEFTGRGEPFLFGVGDSDALRQEAAAAATQAAQARRAPRSSRASALPDARARYLRSARWAGSATLPLSADPDAGDDLRAVVAVRAVVQGERDRLRRGCARSCSRSETPSSRSTGSRATRSPATTRDARAASAGSADLSRPRGTAQFAPGPVTLALRGGARACSGRPRRRRVGHQQPPQPKSGPGGSDYTHRGWRVQLRRQRNPTRGTSSSRSGRARARLRSRS